jgi:excinuclease ABC subunit A
MDSFSDQKYLRNFRIGNDNSIQDIPEEALDYIYNGCHKEFNKDLKYAGITKKIKISFDG